MNKLFLYKIVFFFIFLLFIQQVNAQWYNPDKVNKKAVVFYETAYQDATTNGNYLNSISNLTEALKIDPNYLDALLARADIYARVKNYAASASDYESIFSKDSLYAKSFLLQYATSLAGNGKFEKALENTNKFLAISNLQEKNKKAGIGKQKSFEFAVSFAKKIASKNYIFNPINMGENINSTNLEYLPSITVDGNKMIFNKRIDSDEDFYESEKINGVWQKAKLVPGKINTNLNEGAQNISQDGQWLIFTGCNYPEGFGSCDLYISYKNKNGEWSEAENLGKTINTDAWESAPTLSPDKRDLYFSSTRVGGFGGSDIWVSHNINGQWQKPENLGAGINTSGDDGCPYIHADNQTLYFNSNGRLGYGMSDLFVSRRNENGKWQQPENLGYPINTVDDEGSMIVAADGKTAYYASDKGDFKNKIDLYSFTLREDIQALKTLWVKGKIYDKKTNAGLPSTVELTTIDSGFVLSKLQTDEDGNYLTTLPIGKNYAFNVNRKGYLLYSENFSMKVNISDSSMVVNIALQPIEKGASIILKNIFFDSKKAELQTSSFAELDKLVNVLLENNKLIIQINGYTDNVGKPADNLKLSVNRTKSVIAYLQKKGIDAKRLLGKGFGETKPIANNNTELGRAQNRRTEIIVISN
jgi:outer membrane protein OmpA-like peptidoglycan-associated protein/tetratricopeptide (TPR) repeat protein